MFIMYILKNDLNHCTQLLMRDANINHINKDGKTALHLAVENKVEYTTIKFLLTYRANPHIEDKEGLDVCDKVKSREFGVYTKDQHYLFKVFWSNQCIKNPSLRQKTLKLD